MATLSDEMKRMVEQQRLGFVATVCPDGTPSVSPKGTLSVLDDDHLVFADIRSPGTVANLRANPGIEVNVVDPFARKGYRFKGRAGWWRRAPNSSGSSSSSSAVEALTPRGGFGRLW